eukprot:GHVT01044746.1.p1 GENE.GHVT01044746.1~~GHVT01044746.1.p1  ORF type:complete len:287 (-),score=-2.11 GHVT01044746.1:1566-2426(-)
MEVHLLQRPIWRRELESNYFTLAHINPHALDATQFFPVRFIICTASRRVIHRTRCPVIIYTGRPPSACRAKAFTKKIAHQTELLSVSSTRGAYTQSNSMEVFMLKGLVGKLGARAFSECVGACGSQNSVIRTTACEGCTSRGIRFCKRAGTDWGAFQHSLRSSRDRRHRRRMSKPICIWDPRQNNSCPLASRCFASIHVAKLGIVHTTKRNEVGAMWMHCQSFITRTTAVSNGHAMARNASVFLDYIYFLFICSAGRLLWHLLFIYSKSFVDFPTVRLLLQSLVMA